MSSPSENQLVDDEEIIYRRIRMDCYENGILNTLGLKPIKQDETGISVDRAISKNNPKFKSIEDAAKSPTQPDKQYYVAVFRVSDLRDKGMDVVSKPRPDHPSHAEIPGMTYEKRHSEQVLEWMNILATELYLRVEGPFPPDFE